jgi:predicted AAA+ superfamily ATPase
MIKREFWINMIESYWLRRSIVWLAGVRRVGKTSLCQSLQNVEYYDCEMPTVRRLLAEPEEFLSSKRGSRIVLDEIHRIDNPTEILKIAADHFPDIKIIATGSSTLGASRKFKDSLTGRKLQILLTPLLFQEGELFGSTDLAHRVQFGGLPPFFLMKTLPQDLFEEWLASFWARDIQELFRLEKRSSFLKFAELLLVQSGTVFEPSRFATICEVSRPTINNYLAILEDTFFVRKVRPFSTHAVSEISQAAKIYSFDTGFICHARGWQTIRLEDLGILWEHIVLNDLIGTFPSLEIDYWRDKKEHEIDFILRKDKGFPIAIECKLHSKSFNPKNLHAFRYRYPEGENYVVSHDIIESFEREYDTLRVKFVSLSQLSTFLRKERPLT